jgi:hypothetical protein
VIPDSIGGFAWAWTKCKERNEEVRSSIEAAVVRDDSIVFSVNALREELPELASKFDERTHSVAQTHHGPIEARPRDGAFQLLTTKDEDRARRQLSADARQGLETFLPSGTRAGVGGAPTCVTARRTVTWADLTGGLTLERRC